MAIVVSCSSLRVSGGWDRDGNRGIRLADIWYPTLACTPIHNVRLVAIECTLLGGAYADNRAQDSQRLKSGLHRSSLLDFFRQARVCTLRAS